MFTSILYSKPPTKAKYWFFPTQPNPTQPNQQRRRRGPGRQQQQQQQQQDRAAAAETNGLHTAACLGWDPPQNMQHPSCQNLIMSYIGNVPLYSHMPTISQKKEIIASSIPTYPLAI